MPAPINSAQAASNSATEHQENTEDMRRTPRTCTLDPKPSSPKSGGEKPLNRQHHLKNKKTSHQHRTPKNTEDMHSRPWYDCSGLINPEISIGGILPPTGVPHEKTNL